MSNFTLQQLLTYDPVNALCIRMNDVLETSLNPRYVSITNLTPSNGQRVTVEVKAREELHGYGTAKFINRAEIQLDRLDVRDVFGTEMLIDHKGEILARDVGNHIARITGIVFDDDDFTDQVITDVDNVLIMNPRSLRWYGQLIIRRPSGN